MRTKLFSMTALLALALMSSCGNSEKKTETESTEAPKSMIADAPKDDGQGVGKYRNIALQPLDDKIAAQGKIVFEAKCSACHKATEKKVVGPGLKGVTQRRQAAWILNMITNPIEMTKSDPTAKDLLATHLTQMTFQDVSDEQAKQILEFFRKNDSGAPTAEAKK
jgi:mono/diheme cytochrome c family protein